MENIRNLKYVLKEDGLYRVYSKKGLTVSRRIQKAFKAQDLINEIEKEGCHKIKVA